MRRIVLALSLALLAGCSVLERLAPGDARPGGATPAAGTPAFSVATRTTGQELLEYLARLRTLAEGQLAAEAARQRVAAARAPSDLARVKAAMALTLAHHADDAEIVSLVEPITKRDGGDAEVRAMAGFLQVLAADRRRLKESSTAAGMRLREERRAHDALKQRAEAAQERAAQLQQKLDALTELEKSLSDRQVQNR